MVVVAGCVVVRCGSLSSQLEQRQESVSKREAEVLSRELQSQVTSHIAGTQHVDTSFASVPSAAGASTDRQLLLAKMEELATLQLAHTELVAWKKAAEARRRRDESQAERCALCSLARREKIHAHPDTTSPQRNRGGGGGDLPEPSDLPNRCGLCRCMCWLGTRYRRLADKAEVAQMALEEEQANLVARKQDIEAREASLAAEEQALRGMKVRRQGIDLCRRVTHTHTRCGTQHHRRAVVMRGD